MIGSLSKAIRKNTSPPVRTLRTAGGRLRHPDTTLVFLVEAAHLIVEDWAGQKVGAHGLGLHLTVFYPFFPVSRLEVSHQDGLAEILAAVEPIEYSLTRTGLFSGGFYLAPEPAEPFIDLTQRIQARWPRLQPYRGHYDTVIPHVLISDGHQATPNIDTLEGHLPINAKASALTLARETFRGWRTIRTYQL